MLVTFIGREIIVGGVHREGRSLLAMFIGREITVVGVHWEGDHVGDVHWDGDHCW